jgi:hypothetical protein
MEARTTATASSGVCFPSRVAPAITAKFPLQKVTKPAVVFGGNYPFRQAADALRRSAEQRPDIGRASESRILPAVVQSGDGRHNGLEDETETHQLVRTLQQVMPEALANFRREAVGNRAGDQERDCETDGHTSQKNLIFRCRR